jgi:hypothetical protein
MSKLVLLPHLISRLVGMISPLILRAALTLINENVEQASNTAWIVALN